MEIRGSVLNLESGLMDVITTHINADFDCLGAMIAARRLYPDAVLVFPGGQERGLRNFLLQSTLYAYDFKRAKDIDLQAVRRLILVDVRHARRIGPFAELINKKGVELHIYDHHPLDKDSLRGDVEHVREVGAATTVMTQLFIERGIEPTADEATMMMLGLYEDTGNLLFNSTTPSDYQAAAFLLQYGANLHTVSDFLIREMTPEQVALLSELLKTCRRLTVNGVEVAIAHASVELYVVEIASLAHKLKDIENLDALVIVVRMADRVFMVARSRLAEVNVGDLLQEFGGGGHAFAASATVRDLTLVQVLDQLELKIPQYVRSRCEARHLMSTPVKTLPQEATVKEARELLTRYNFNAAPVLSDRQVSGIVTRQTVERAAHHRLLHLPLTDVMYSDFSIAAPDTPLEVLQEAMVSNSQRIVPVLLNDELVGVVTRTDLLRHMIGASYVANGRSPSAESSPGVTRLKRKSLNRLIEARLPRNIRKLLHRLGETGDELGLRVYLVGGFVRDLLLRQENLDIDLVVEGDGIVFAEAFASSNDCRVRSHHKFRTAVLIFPDGFKVDVASARIEFYDKPAALPKVEYASLRHDLYRRDFSINTLTVALNHTEFGQLLDFFNGQRDIKEKSIRVLHNLSFIEDPTRVFRAIRFEQRIDFKIGRQTERLMRSAVRMGLVEKVGGVRICNELVQILSENQVISALQRMQQFELLRFIHPDLEFDDKMAELFKAAGRSCNWFDLLYTGEHYKRWLVNLLCLLDQLNKKGLGRVSRLLALKPEYRLLLHEELSAGRKSLAVAERSLLRHSEPAASQIYHCFSGLSLEVLLYLVAKAKNEATRKCLSHFVTHLRQVAVEIDGNDLIKIGLPPGPEYQEIFAQVLDAKLDGLVQTRGEELVFAQKIVNGLGK